MNVLPIKIEPGNTAPKYEHPTKELKIELAVITEKGMESGLPIVDFQLVDEQGNKYFAATTGKLMIMLAGAIQGVNMRNHGSTDP